MSEVKKKEDQETAAGEKPERPEPPKDENGKPIRPPFPGHHGSGPEGKDGKRPEPPKDENGNPIRPPFPGHHGPRPEKPAEGTQEEAAAVSGTVLNI